MKFKKSSIITLILVLGGFVLVILQINMIRSQIMEIAGLAVAQTPRQWNNVKDASGASNIHDGVLASHPYLADGGGNFVWWRGSPTTGAFVNIVGSPNVVVTSAPNSVIFQTPLNTLMAGVNALGNGAATNITYLIGRHTWQVIWSGAPNEVIVELHGRIDGAGGNTWAMLDSSALNNYEMRHIANKGITEVRASVNRLTGGADANVIVQIISGGI